MPRYSRETIADTDASSTQPKSLIQSNTIRWALLGFLVSILSTASTPLADHFGNKYPAHKSELAEIANSLRTICAMVGVYATGQTIAGRVGAGGVYTPNWMPGPDQADLQPELQLEAAISQPEPQQTTFPPPFSPAPIIVVQDANEALSDG